MADLLARGSLFVHGSGSGTPGWRQVQALLDVADDPARGKVATAMALVRSRHEAAMATVRAALA